MWLTRNLIKNLQQTLPSQRTVPPLRYITQAGVFVDEYHLSNWKEKNSIINPFAPGDFAEKRVLKLVERFSGHCRTSKS